MVERRTVLLHVTFILSVGVWFYTLVNSQELRKRGSIVQTEDEELVRRERSVGREKKMEMGRLEQDADRKEKERFVNKKRSHKGKKYKELQTKTQNDNMGIGEFKAEKRDLFGPKIRKTRAEPETPPSSEPEVSHESKANSEANPNSKSESEPFFNAEPEPNWDTAMEVWKIAWPLHVYGIASIFIGLGITSLLELIRIHVKSRRKTSLKVSLLIMIAVFCITRAVILLMDPYSSKSNLNPILSRLLFSIGHPCIVSAMSLLLLVLIDTTKMNVAPPTFQRVQFIIGVLVFHVVLVLVTDVLVSHYFQAKVFILICQIYYLLLGFMLSIGYAKVGIKIAINSSACVTRDTNMQKLKNLIGLASVTGLCIVGVTIYGATGVFGIYSAVKVVDPWPWWVFQTILRTLELIMVIVLLVMNVKVSGSGLSIQQLFEKCRKKFFQNKVAGSTSVTQVSKTNSWFSQNINTT